MKHWVMLCVVVFLAVPAVVSAQQGFSSNRGLEMQFTTVTGTVTDEAGRTVPGIRVNIREADVAPGSVPSQDDFGAWGVEAIPNETTSDPTRDSEIFAWGETDEKGRYEITGVRRPGAYILIIRSGEGYHRVDAPISVAGSVGKTFKADLVLRALVGAAPPSSVSVQGLVAVAREAEAQGDLDTAIAKIQEVADLAPESPVPRFHLARLSMANGDAERAAAEIQSACELDPTCGDCWLLRAQIARGAGNAEEASTSAAKAVELMPENDDAQGILGLQLYEAQQYGEAMPYLEKSVELGSTDPNVWVYKANCYVAGHQLGKAIAAYEEFLEKFPDAANRAQVEQILPQIKAMAEQQ
jgi:cytochrome c-type biogenesis protein CcmH/NrfG